MVDPGIPDGPTSLSGGCGGGEAIVLLGKRGIVVADCELRLAAVASDV